MRLKVLAVVLLALVATAPGRAERIKDMAQVQGVRTNQLVGYGLVVLSLIHISAGAAAVAGVSVWDLSTDWLLPTEPLTGASGSFAV